MNKEQKKLLLDKVEEIYNAEGMRDSYEDVRNLCGELKGMIKMIEDKE